LLKVSRKKTQPFPSFNSRSRQNQTLNLPFREHADRQHGGQKRFPGSCRSQGKGEVVALHGVHVTFLSQGPWPQGLALRTSHQHLFCHRRVVVAATCIQSPQSRLKINGRHRLTVLPNGANQLDNRRGSLNLRSMTSDHQLKTPQHD
jgi:hypothetical protein